MTIEHKQMRDYETLYNKNYVIIKEKSTFFRRLKPDKCAKSHTLRTPYHLKGMQGVFAVDNKTLCLKQVQQILQSYTFDRETY